MCPCRCKNGRTSYRKIYKEGKPVAIPGHNLPLGALGVFILWFCWFGFNCGSTTAATYNLGDIAMTTNLAAAAATLVTLIVTWVRYGKPDISMTMNGALAGLVAITASCDVVNDYEALFIGAVAGVVVVFAVEFFDKVVKSMTRLVQSVYTVSVEHSEPYSPVFSARDAALSPR